LSEVRWPPGATMAVGLAPVLAMVDTLPLPSVIDIR
jgi:hypothetical protein